MPILCISSRGIKIPVVAKKYNFAVILPQILTEDSYHSFLLIPFLIFHHGFFHSNVWEVAYKTCIYLLYLGLCRTFSRMVVTTFVLILTPKQALFCNDNHLQEKNMQNCEWIKDKSSILAGNKCWNLFLSVSPILFLLCIYYIKMFTRWYEKSNHLMGSLF